MACTELLVQKQFRLKDIIYSNKYPFSNKHHPLLFKGKKMAKSHIKWLWDIEISVYFPIFCLKNISFRTSELRLSEYGKRKTKIILSKILHI